MAAFELGQIVATPAALELLERNRLQPIRLILRHVGGDWGELCEEDVKANEQAIAYGDRVLSAYTVAGTKLYVITEADRSATTLLLASEY
jgi:UDP-N-acetylmuramyl pentapeptide synthase